MEEGLPPRIPVRTTSATRLEAVRVVLEELAVVLARAILGLVVEAAGCGFLKRTQAVCFSTLQLTKHFGPILKINCFWVGFGTIARRRRNICGFLTSKQNFPFEMVHEFHDSVLFGTSCVQCVF